MRPIWVFAVMSSVLAQPKCDVDDEDCHLNQQFGASGSEEGTPDTRLPEDETVDASIAHDGEAQNPELDAIDDDEIERAAEEMFQKMFASEQGPPKGSAPTPKSDRAEGEPADDATPTTIPPAYTDEEIEALANKRFEERMAHMQKLMTGDHEGVDPERVKWLESVHEAAKNDPVKAWELLQSGGPKQFEDSHAAPRESYGEHKIDRSPIEATTDALNKIMAQLQHSIGNIEEDRIQTQKTLDELHRQRDDIEAEYELYILFWVIIFVTILMISGLRFLRGWSLGRERNRMVVERLDCLESHSTETPKARRRIRRASSF